MTRPVRWFIGTSAAGLSAFYAPFVRADVSAGRLHMTILNGPANVSFLADSFMGGGHYQLRVRRPSKPDMWITRPDPAEPGVGSTSVAWAYRNRLFGGTHALVAGCTRWVWPPLFAVIAGLLALTGRRVGSAARGRLSRQRATVADVAA